MKMTCPVESPLQETWTYRRRRIRVRVKVDRHLRLLQIQKSLFEEAGTDATEDQEEKLMSIIVNSTV